MICDDDFFGDDVRDNGGVDIDTDDATSRKVSNKLYNDGYRIGKGKEEEMQMQIGFDVGFERGMMSGRACGCLYAACRLSMSTRGDAGEVAQTTINLEKLLFESVSDTGHVSSELIESLRALVLSISAELIVDFQRFENDLSLLPEISDS